MSNNLFQYNLTSLGKDIDSNRLYSCPCCNDTIVVKESLFYGQCQSCYATIIDYTPAPHQTAFHESYAKFKLNLGGYGSGKTTMCCGEVASHSMSIPNGRTLITGPKLQQISDAVLPELLKFIPPHFIKKKVMHPTFRLTLTNNHEIIVYASNDQEKLRSLNLTGFYIEEASGVDYSIFEQLQARLRNKAAAVKDSLGNIVYYDFMGLICSNPEDNGWFMDKFILMSDRIYASESIDLSAYKLLKSDKTEHLYHTFLSSSRDNVFLPDSYVKELCVGKSPTWVSKYIDCNLEIKDGVVYPDFVRHIVEPFPIPDTWARIAGFDKGFRDETAFPIAAIDPKTGVIYVYDEHYVAEKPMSYHAEHIKDMLRGIRLLRPVQADPTVRNRNERDGVTYKHYFYKISGIMLEEANNDIDFGIEKVRNYMYLGKLKFFSNCVNIKKEALKYSYHDVSSVNKGTPIDRHNHLWDAIRYMIVGLPDDPMDIFSIYNMPNNKSMQNVYSKSFGGYDDSDLSAPSSDIITTQYFTSGRY